MNTTMQRTRLSVKTQTLATLGALLAAVAIPQLFHFIGAASGLGTGLGAAILPMHLPIMLVGLLAGPFAGAIAGVLAPAVSFMLSGMPVAASLPFMMVELFGYGLCAGLLSKVKMPVLGKVVLIQLAGRFLRMLAVLVAIYAFANTSVNVLSVWTSVQAGLLGIVLQWAFLPLLVYRVEHGKHDAN